MTTIFAIITTGGEYIKPYQVSSKMLPEHTLKFGNIYNLLKQTFLSLSEFVDDKNIITVTEPEYYSDLTDCLKDLKDKFSRKKDYILLTEPEAKNTANSIALGTKYISDNLNFATEDCVIVTIPSNIEITDRKSFALYVKKGISLAKEGYFVAYFRETEEIKENYDYIKLRKSQKISETEADALKVTEFISGEEKAALKGKKTLNTGIYMFTPKTFFSELKKHEKEIYKTINEIRPQTLQPVCDTTEYGKQPYVSIEKAITEKSKNIAAIPLPESCGCKKLPEMFFRPWGNYAVLEEGKGYLTKCITVNPGQKLSLQLHHHRSEHWIAEEGTATVIKGNKSFLMNPGESTDIEVKEVHSLQNETDKPIKILEIQKGNILDENDIERLEDIYGRV